MSFENDTPKEPSAIADQLNDLRENELNNYRETVKKARNALFWAAGLLFAGEMLAMFRAYSGVDPLVLVISLVEAGLFIGLAFWTSKKPYTAIITGLVLFILIVIFSIVVNGFADGAAGAGKALMSGIILKVFILVNLIRPLKDAKALQEAMSTGQY